MKPPLHRQIVVIDDHADTAEVVVEMLRRMRYQACAIPSDRRVLQRLTDISANGGIELIVTDLFMPEPDGFEIIRYVRSHLSWVPVIGMSGGHTAMLGSMLTFGAAAVIEKPIDPAELKCVVDRTLLRLPRDLPTSSH